MGSGESDGHKIDVAGPKKPPWTEEDLLNIQWVVWFARKHKGTVAEVAKRALEQNPYLYEVDKT